MSMPALNAPQLVCAGASQCIPFNSRRPSLRPASFPACEPALQRLSAVHQLRCSAKHASSSESATASNPSEAVLAAPATPDPAVGAAWDPEGLFASAPSTSGGHLARRERERSARLAQQRTVPGSDIATASHAGNGQASPGPGSPPSPARPKSQDPGSRPGSSTPAQTSHAGSPNSTRSTAQPANECGVPVSGLSKTQREELRKTLQSRYMDVDLDLPGLRIVCSDPPIFTIEAFMDGAGYCESMIQGASSTGRMQGSLVGAGYVAGGGNAVNARRTSQSLLLADDVARAQPQLSQGIEQLRERTRKLLPAGRWGAAGRLPAVGQFCFESEQIARYSEGQHFLSHEDAFPTELAADNGFQRRATLLLYLNDVAFGGGTRFETLGLTVQPRAGCALLFFPAFADGKPDARTLHTAESAVDEKWIVQQWIVCGVAGATLPPLTSSTWGSSWAAQQGEDEDEAASLSALEARRRPKKKGAKAGSANSKSKGFGRK